MQNTPYSLAYQRWFSSYESERRRQRKRKGARLSDFPDPPTHPDDIARAVDQIGAREVVRVLGVHRSTLARWLSGASVIPRAAWLVIVMLSDGRLPGMGEAWRDFRFVGDKLVHIGTRNAYTAQEIAGMQYHLAHAAALSRRLSAAEKEIAHLLKVGDFQAANDPIICAS